jgi:hypothetical protein
MEPQDATAPPGPPLAAEQSVYTRDGVRVGQIQAVASHAFKVWGTAERPAFWIRKESVDRVTPGGVVYLVVGETDLGAAHWVPAPLTFP